MKKLLLILLVTALGEALFAQQQPALKNLTSLTDTLRTPQPDSLKAKAQHKLDSLNGLSHKVNSKADSLQKILNKPADKVNGALSGVENKIEKVEQGATSKVDALKNQITPDKPEGLNKLENTQSNLQNRADQASDKVTSAALRAEGKVEEKVKEISGENVNIPGVEKLNVPDVKMPGVETPNVSLPGADANLPDVNLDPSLKTDIPGTDKLDINKNIPDVKTELPNTDIPKPEELDKLNEISGEIDKVSEKVSEVDQYSKELDKIKEGGLQDAEALPEKIEEQATNIDEVKALEGEVGKVTKQQAEYEAMIQRYRDKKLLQDEIMRKAKNVATDKLAEFNPMISKAQAEMSKMKKVNPAVQSFKDITKKRPNEMKGKPMRERFVPGITFQVYNNSKFVMDLATQTGYRISGRLTTGLGFTYRFSVSEKNPDWIRNEGIYGGRFYTDFTLLKGVYVHGDFELLHLDKDKMPLTSDTFRSQVWQSNYGLGKRYNISRKVKGSVMALYRVEYKGDVPGLNKVVLRMGFDLNLKKREKLVFKK
ncbi:MAG: hypothetical protein ACOYXT_05505 [Bacteroidota bacterium]